MLAPSLYPIVLFHVVTAVIGLLSGMFSMFVRKGGGLHAVAGNIFFTSMLGMSSSGAYLGAREPIMLNVMVGVITFYLVATSWRAARHRSGTAGAFEWLALAYGIGAVAFAYGCGVLMSAGVIHERVKIPVPMFFVFGTVALLAVIGDVRVVRRGGFFGTVRISRHLWRMCTALLVGLMSLFPGRPGIIPSAIRHTPLPLLPHLFVLGSMIFYLVRYARRRRAARVAAPVAAQPALSS